MCRAELRCVVLCRAVVLSRVVPCRVTMNNEILCGAMCCVCTFYSSVSLFVVHCDVWSFVS